MKTSIVLWVLGGLSFASCVGLLMIGWAKASQADADEELRQQAAKDAQLADKRAANRSQLPPLAKTLTEFNNRERT